MLRECSPLALLHNLANSIGIEACEKIMPGVKQVIIFRFVSQEAAKNE